MTVGDEGMVTLTSTSQDRPDTGDSTTSADTSSELVITENRQLGIYEATVAGANAAAVVYNGERDKVTLLATSVFPEFRGQGIASRLLSGVLDTLRAEGKKAILFCPFAADFVEAHPEYADVIHSAVPGTGRRRH